MFSRLILLLAEIPLFDWNGHEFLIFYITTLAVVMMVCMVRARSAVRRFEIGRDAAPDLSDPYEIAFLMGGPQRVLETVIAKLVSKNAVKWSNSITSIKLMVSEKTPPEADPLESVILHSLQRQGSGGVAVEHLYPAMVPALSGLEKRLAILGVRPTVTERDRAGYSAAMPLLVLMLIGFIKVCVGLDRGKPVLFLVALLVISLLGVLAVISMVPRLTLAGRKASANIKAKQALQLLPTENSSPDEIGLAVASQGLACLTGVIIFSGFPLSHLKQLDHVRNANSGCSAGASGCSSGCGGGGCGGCGGN